MIETIIMVSGSVAVVGLSVLLGYSLGVDAQYKEDKKNMSIDAVYIKVPQNLTKKESEDVFEKELKRNLAWKEEDFKRYSIQYNGYIDALEKAEELKQSKTIKYIKEQIKNQSILMKSVDNDITGVKEILAEHK